MTRNLTALMCALILAVFGALAMAEPASSSPSAQPSQAVAPAPVAHLFLAPTAFMSEGTCPRIPSSTLPAPKLMIGCLGGWGDPCDRNLDCKGYSCPYGEARLCYGGTGSGCLGTCGCG
jgi:hypothetical protein